MELRLQFLDQPDMSSKELMSDFLVLTNPEPVWWYYYMRGVSPRTDIFLDISIGTKSIETPLDPAGWREITNWGMPVRFAVVRAE